MLQNYKIYGIKPLFKSLLKMDDWNRLKNVDILFVDHDGHRSYTYDNKAYAPLIDSLQEVYLNKGYSCLTIASPFSQLTGNKAFGEVIDFNGSFVRAAISRILRNLLSKETYFGTRCLKEVWDQILLATNPRRVIAIQPDAALCLACRNRGIDVTDLQHGVISDEHPWYGESYRKGCKTEVLPTTFMCWDKAAVVALEKWTIKKEILVETISNPWLQRFIENDEKDKLVSDAIARQSWIFRLPRRKKILVTLGWGFTDEAMNGQFLSFPLSLVNVILENSDEYIWLIKPHPIQLRGVERKPLETFLLKHFGQRTNVFWEEVSTTPLPLLLLSTDLHLTISSTVTSEAAMFGIPTGLIAPVPLPALYLKSYFENELRSGIAQWVPNFDQDIRLYISNRERGGVKAPPEPAEYIVSKEKVKRKTS